jgi:hypothetical protein
MKKSLIITTIAYFLAVAFIKGTFNFLSFSESERAGIIFLYIPTMLIAFSSVKLLELEK